MPSSSVVAKLSSSQASKTSPLRAPVTVASTAWGARSSRPAASADAPTVSGRKYCSRAAVLVFDLDERQEQRLRPAPQQPPVDEPGRRTPPPLAAEPALPLQERQQPLALDEGPDVAVEQRLPRRADQQPGRLHDLAGRGQGARGRRDRGQLQAEPVERVRARG